MRHKAVGKRELRRFHRASEEESTGSRGQDQRSDGQYGHTSSSVPQRQGREAPEEVSEGL